MKTTRITDVQHNTAVGERSRQRKHYVPDKTICMTFERKLMSENAWNQTLYIMHVMCARLVGVKRCCTPNTANRAQSGRRGQLQLTESLLYTQEKNVRVHP